MSDYLTVRVPAWQPMQAWMERALGSIVIAAADAGRTVYVEAAESADRLTVTAPGTEPRR